MNRYYNFINLVVSLIFLTFYRIKNVLYSYFEFLLHVIPVVSFILIKAQLIQPVIKSLVINNNTYNIIIVVTFIAILLMVTVVVILVVFKVSDNLNFWLGIVLSLLFIFNFGISVKVLFIIFVLLNISDYCYLFISLVIFIVFIKINIFSFKKIFSLIRVFIKKIYLFYICKNFNILKFLKNINNSNNGVLLGMFLVIKTTTRDENGDSIDLICLSGWPFTIPVILLLTLLLIFVIISAIFDLDRAEKNTLIKALFIFPQIGHMISLFYVFYLIEQKAIINIIFKFPKIFGLHIESFYFFAESIIVFIIVAASIWGIATWFMLFYEDIFPSREIFVISHYAVLMLTQAIFGGHFTYKTVCHISIYGDRIWPTVSELIEIPKVIVNAWVFFDSAAKCVFFAGIIFIFAVVLAESVFKKNIFLFFSNIFFYGGVFYTLLKLVELTELHRALAVFFKSPDFNELNFTLAMTPRETLVLMIFVIYWFVLSSCLLLNTDKKTSGRWIFFMYVLLIVILVLYVYNFCPRGTLPRDNLPDETVYLFGWVYLFGPIIFFLFLYLLYPTLLFVFPYFVLNDFGRGFLLQYLGTLPYLVNIGIQWYFWTLSRTYKIIFFRFECILFEDFCFLATINPFITMVLLFISIFLLSVHFRSCIISSLGHVRFTIMWFMLSTTVFYIIFFISTSLTFVPGTKNFLLIGVLVFIFFFWPVALQKLSFIYIDNKVSVKNKKKYLMAFGFPSIANSMAGNRVVVVNKKKKIKKNKILTIRQRNKLKLLAVKTFFFKKKIFFKKIKKIGFCLFGGGKINFKFK